MTRFTREEADEQFNPTLWTRRLPTDDLLPSHEAFTTTRSSAYRASLGASLHTRPFGEEAHRGTMDVYRPDGLRADAPIVVYIHGGWWQWFSNEQFGYLAEPFNRNGYAVVMPAYRMAQDWQNDEPMESIVRQMETAVAAILEEAVERGAPAVHIVGHSAGGHLAAMLHRTDWSALGVSDEGRAKLRSVFSLAGLFDIRPLVDSYVNEAIGMTEDSASRVSPHLLDVPDTPAAPLHLVLPEYDTPEFFRQTKAYQERLLRAGQPCDLHVLPARDHLDMIERLPEHGDPLLELLLTAMAQAEVTAASRDWITSFNAGDVATCAATYTEQAQMNAKPVGAFVGRGDIEAFWSGFVADTGASDLVYENVRLTMESPTRARLAADWSMNVGSGIITNELWVKQADGAWRLEEDDFEVQATKSV